MSGTFKASTLGMLKGKGTERMPMEHRQCQKGVPVMVIHLPNLGLPESMLEQADNAEYQAKCQSCGDMFQLDSLDPEDIAVCPMCQQSVRLGDAVILGCSNEDY
ncbi:MAG TPA: hypothetical protein DHW84_03120 [Firmicutes bacterium]|nr:hypothetical protein [Bacillota bacterium]